ncbi:TlpA disulfide reductase family protein [Lacibacter sp. H407]|uniref:TlpA disulfide reductase family protein n=1 Tax=Lacibacter sp. H407 TaxID=3133423 RepID=UPI0030C2DA2B
MKNIFTYLFLLPFCTEIQSQDSNFILQGKINGFNEGIIYLNYRDSKSADILDSAVVQNGDFSFKGNISEPTKVYLYSSAKKKTDSEGTNDAQFFIEPAIMKLQLVHGKFSEVKLVGSKTQDDWKYYNEQIKTYEIKWKPVLSTIKKAESEKNWTLYDSLTDKYMIPYTEGKERLYIDFVYANPNSYISIDLLSFNRHRLQFDSLNLFYQKLASNIKQTTGGIELGKFVLKEGSLQIGKQAPAILFTDKDGIPRKLSDFKGKFILLDFWASWCVPCRQESPYLVEVYKKYQTKGFEIISFSLDREKEKQAWLDAIVQDSMSWIQVCDFKYWNSEIAKAFNLFGRGIPVNFLLDADGKIIGRDIRAWKLEEYLLRYIQ